jgi:hypothetical protein
MNCSWLGSNKRYRTGAKIDIARIDSKLPLQGASRWFAPATQLDHKASVRPNRLL